VLDSVGANAKSEMAVVCVGTDFNSVAGQIGTIEIVRIRRNGGTQCRTAIARQAVGDYATRMKYGEEFPPVRIWFDGYDYWLSDGFHRIAALEQLGRTTVVAEIRDGSLNDAIWDSCSANSAHGIRRSRTDLVVAVRRALAHPYANQLSRREIARHLGVADSTFRRIAKYLSAPDGADDTRVVLRNGTEYRMDVHKIGQAARPDGPKSKTLHDLRTGLRKMHTDSPLSVRPILNVIGHWIFGVGTESDCLRALERLVIIAPRERSPDGR
jgi:hypothetical protein